MDDLGTVAETYRRFLSAEPLSEFAVTDLDVTGVPVWQVWLPSGPGHPVGGIGYGSDLQQARVGAYGEATESLLAERAGSRRSPEDGSYADLRRRHGEDSVVDPRLLGLPVGAPFDDDRPLRWLRTRRLRDGAPVLVPAEYVADGSATLPGPPPPAGWLTVPVTNGMGAGLDLDRAITHGLLEALQRDGNGLVFRALDAGAVLDLTGLEDPPALDTLDRLRAAGVTVTAKLASTEFGVANVYVVGEAPGDGVLTASACGEAAHPDREVALRKALQEFASARARKLFMHGPLKRVADVAPPGYLEGALPLLDPADEEPRVLDAMVRWLQLPEQDWRPPLERTVFARTSSTAVTELPTAPGLSGRALLDELAGRLQRHGLDVLVADLSPVDGGVHAAKVVVPGLEVETVAYGRIGERGVRRLQGTAHADLVRVGAAPPGWARVHLTPAAEERLGGPAWLDRAELDRRCADLLPLYREPSRHTAQQVLEAAA